jgi:hypothetical protein
LSISGGRHREGDRRSSDVRVDGVELAGELLVVPGAASAGATLVTSIAFSSPSSPRASREADQGWRIGESVPVEVEERRNIGHRWRQWPPVRGGQDDDALVALP